MSLMPPICVSALVSTFNAERFLVGCIQDLEDQTIAERLEIVVIDSGSEQNEKVIVREFQQHYDNIRYVRTENREPLYAAWNRGIRLARGRYLTNANTDDRHRRDAFERMAAVLDMRPDVALVYGDVIKTEIENEVNDHCTPSGRYRWYDWDRYLLLTRGCFIGPQPMWRKSVHDRYGYFDERLVTSGDYEFWLRISQTLNFYHIREPLGLDLVGPASIEHRQKADVMGYSLGSYLAQQLTITYPDKVNSLILVGSSCGGKDHTPKPSEFIKLQSQIVNKSLNNVSFSQEEIKSLVVASLGSGWIKMHPESVSIKILPHCNN